MIVLISEIFAFAADKIQAAYKENCTGSNLFHFQ